MEASVAEQVEAHEEATRPTEAVAPDATPSKMFRYSEYINIGPGAVECEHGHDGQCEDPEHFHAWCRLPNSFQHNDIREKGLAAKALRIRALRDPESDSYAVLEGELAEVNEERFRNTLIDDILAREMTDDYLEAQETVDQREEFEGIHQQREEYARLAVTNGDLPTEEQSEEWKAVNKILDEYTDAIRVELDAIQAPKRAQLEQRDFDSLIELVRTMRINEDADRRFLDVYNAWTWFVGTFEVEPHQTTQRPWKPKWTEIGHPLKREPDSMYAESPEVIDALRSTYIDLRAALQRGARGN